MKMRGSKRPRSMEFNKKLSFLQGKLRNKQIKKNKENMKIQTFLERHFKKSFS